VSHGTLFQKIWDAHQVADLAGARTALVIDRVALHELSGGYALRDMMAGGERPCLEPDQVFAVADHAISTEPGRGPRDSKSPGGAELIAFLEESCAALKFRYVRPEDPAHGIVHVAGPEQGFVLPGTTYVCGDSHTCTVGAFGALAFAVGSSELTTVLRRGALILKRPKTLRITLSGRLQAQVFSKDVALHLLSRFGVRLGVGCAIEFSGPVIDGWSMEARMTLCNMAAELGARYALIAPDDTTFDYLRHMIPRKARDEAIASWSSLRSDADAKFDQERTVEVDPLVPQVTWGITPAQTVGIDQVVPEPVGLADQLSTDAVRQALQYMQLAPGRKMCEIPIDAAFIGSCTNGRMDDLRAAAAILRGRKVAKGVRAMCTPGSMRVRAQAEAEGLDLIFKEAGFEWRKSGCSNCAGREGPIWEGLRVISSTNRNFQNRQGPRTRTHLASPATVAASAIAGRIADPRAVLAG
jgi:3-isopropylmalate/(R)-2-methylmalate dehydratase large subunit